jgi:hypothetical protein
VPPWVPPTILVGYFGLVTLISLAGVFSETENRREAAQKVLRVLLPLALLTAVAEGITHYVIKG